MPLQHDWAPQELVVINEPRENILRVRVILADPAHVYDKVIATLHYEQRPRGGQPLELKNHADIFDWAVGSKIRPSAAGNTRSR